MTAAFISFLLITLRVSLEWNSQVKPSAFAPQTQWWPSLWLVTSSRQVYTAFSTLLILLSKPALRTLRFPSLAGRHIPCHALPMTSRFCGATDHSCVHLSFSLFPLKFFHYRPQGLHHMESCKLHFTGFNYSLDFLWWRQCSWQDCVWCMLWRDFVGNKEKDIWKQERSVTLQDLKFSDSACWGTWPPVQLGHHKSFKCWLRQNYYCY